MNYKKYFLQITELLRSYQNIWPEEVLNSYPESIDNYLPEWKNLLNNLSDNDLWEIDAHISYDSIKGSSFHHLILKIERLRNLLPKYNNDSQFDIPARSFDHIKLKKKHEIIKILNLLSKLRQTKNYIKIIDIGGGIGHLARFISDYHQIEVASIDQDEKLQVIGKKRLKQVYRNQNYAPIHYINKIFSSKIKVKNFQEEDTMSLGLHTCGNLSLEQFDFFSSSNNLSLVNFGCCYLKLDPYKEVNISQYAKINGLNLTKHSLTLATRSHSQISFDEFSLKKQVKFFRYGLHLLLYHKFNYKKFIGVGETKIKMYQGGFATYASEKLCELNIENNLTLNEINTFYQSESTQKLITSMFHANIIRWQFGRLIEIYILLDRGIYLLENNHQIELFELFDEKISPRNIAIYATK
jgi:hypothetical protein